MWLPEKTLKAFSILGTDTGIGKTYVTCELLNYFNKLSYTTLGVKPIASGAYKDKDVFYNEDALQLQQNSSLKVSYEKINPLVFEKAVTPHIAAKYVSTTLTVNNTLKACENTFKENADIFLVEGCGGLLTPLNDEETLMDFFMALGFPVILVVGMTLGCLNQAQLTSTYLSALKIPVTGWIANFFDPHFEEKEENLETLKKRLPFELLGTVAYDGALLLQTQVVLCRPYSTGMELSNIPDRANLEQIEK